MENRLKYWQRRAALLLAVGLGGIEPGGSQAQPAYTFAPVAFLGDPLPGGGGTFVTDFEPGGLNSQGDMAFGADVRVDPAGEGVFLRHKGQIKELGRTGRDAPGGGTFDFAFLGPVGLNDQGDVVFNFLREFPQPPQPPTPLGVNAGAYRYSHTTRTVTPVVIPFTTPAPSGGTFQGVSFQPTINNRGDEVFAGIVETDQGVHNVPANGEAYIGLGIGTFRANANGHISSVVGPKDAAPGGGTFDYTVEPWVNAGGDVSFIGHIAGEESVVPDFPPQADFISALGGLYIKKGGTGMSRSIVHAGDLAPGGGNFRQVFHDVMNNRGDIAFNGDLTSPPGANQSIGVFVYSGGKITPIARPGDPMPGGGALVNASIVDGNVHINNNGDVVFSGLVDTDADGDGNNDTGLFQWSHGQLSAIARTGTVIPGVGTVDELNSPQLVFPPAPISTTHSGAINNDRGQVLFQATLKTPAPETGRGVFLLATPM